MKTLILSLGLFFLLGSAHRGYQLVEENNSCIKQYNSKLKKDIYSYVDEFPEFPGGLQALMKYLSKNRRIDTNEILGTLKFEIIIDVDGSVIDERIPGKEPSAYTVADKDLLKILRMMPKWKPGKCENQKVPFRYPFLIHICLSY
jgi:hypothetical protein